MTWTQEMTLVQNHPVGGSNILPEIWFFMLCNTLTIEGGSLNEILVASN